MRWLVIRSTLHSQDIDSCMPNGLVRPPEFEKKVVLKINMFGLCEIFMVSMNILRISSDKASNLPKRDVRFILLK